MKTNSKPATPPPYSTTNEPPFSKPGFIRHREPRRSFLRRLGLGALLLTPGAALLPLNLGAAQTSNNNANRHHKKDGDISILRFLAAAEILEADLWQQYNELGGIQDSEVPGGTGNKAYTEKLENLDDDMPDYIHDNTDDEISHAAFLNAYLVSKHAQPVDLEQFRTLPGSTASGS